MYATYRRFQQERQCGNNTAIKEHGGAQLRPGWSFDCRHEDPRTGKFYDLLKSKDRAEVKRLLVEDGVEVLTASPPCTVFSNLQAMNPVGVTAQEWADGCRMLDHAVSMCKLQMSLGKGGSCSSIH